MEPNKEPNLIDKAKSLTTAAYNWSVHDKMQRVSEEVFLHRKNICLACPNWDKDAYANQGKCKLCGCSIVKLYVPHAICPDNPPRWKNVPITS